MLTPAELDDLYESLRPSLENLQVQRTEAVESARRVKVTLFALAIISGIVVSVVTCINVGRIGSPVLAALFVSTIGWGVLGCVIYQFTGGAKIEAHRRNYKSLVIGKTLERLQPSIHYSPKKGVPLETFRDSQLFNERASRYHNEDGFRGMVGATDLLFSEVVAKERRKRGKRTTYVTFFRGLFFQADFHKEFRSSLFVLPDIAESAFGTIGKALQSFRPLSSHQLIYMEDPEFEKHFVVYGTDQVDARYVLSTSMLQRILELQKRWKSEIRLRFQGSVVQVAIPHDRNLFEPDLSKSALSKGQIDALANELAFCFDIVEDLNLNTRVWSKAPQA